MSQGEYLSTVDLCYQPFLGGVPGVFLVFCGFVVFHVESYPALMFFSVMYSIVIMRELVYMLLVHLFVHFVYVT